MQHITEGQTWAETTRLRNDETRTTSPKVPGPKEQQTQPNSACEVATNPAPAVKAFATLQAELARRGYELQQLSGGEFHITRWGLGRVLSDLPSVERFLTQVGGAA